MLKGTSVFSTDADVQALGRRINSVFVPRGHPSEENM